MLQAKILLIDDDDLVLNSIAKLLKNNGCKNFVFVDGEEALIFFELHEVDMIICDMRMPKMDGIATIRKMRDVNKTKNRKPAKEIVITGYVEDAMNAEIEKLNVAECIYKPFEIEPFMQLITKHLLELSA